MAGKHIQFRGKVTLGGRQPLGVSAPCLGLSPLRLANITLSDAKRGGNAAANYFSVSDLWRHGALRWCTGIGNLGERRYTGRGDGLRGGELFEVNRIVTLANRPEARYKTIPHGSETW